MNLSQKSLNRGRSIFFRESLVAASKKEKKLRIQNFLWRNQCFGSWWDSDQNWVCGSWLGFRIQIQSQGGKMNPKIIDGPDVLFEETEASRVWKPFMKAHEELNCTLFNCIICSSTWILYWSGIRINQKAWIGSVSSEYGSERLEETYTQKLKIE
jgi:hypothetical protein